MSAIVVIAQVDPEILSVDIDSIRKSKVKLSLEAKQDIQRLRAVVVIVQVNPEILSADIDSIRRS